MADLSVDNVRRLAPAEIQHLVFGVRYDPQFKVMDQIGAVVDEILRADGTPFDPETFPLSEATPQHHRLLNNETDSWLVVSTQDTILQLQVNTKNEGRVNELAQGFQEYVLQPLRKFGGVKNIARYGVMFRFKEVDAYSFQNPPIKRFLSPDFPQANGMAMQFNRRLGVEEALVRKSVNDFRNAIYSVRQSEAGKAQVSIDYQRYFDPLLDSTDSKPFPAFVGQGTEYIHGEFERWFQKFAAPAEVA